MSCTKDLWQILANRSFRSLFVSLAALFICLSVTDAHSAERVFEHQKRSVADALSPEQLPPSFYTFEPDEYWAEPLDSYWLDFSNWVMRQEHTQGPRIQRFGQWVDRTLSGSAQGLPNNASYVRIGFATKSEYGNLAQFKPEARFRLDIPTTRRKLRLVIESESEELVPLEQRQRDRQLTSPERTNTPATGALHYMTLIGDAINFSNNIGVRLRIPADAFWRATAHKQWHPDANWTLSTEQRVYYYHNDGWGERTLFSAGRPAGNGWYFHSSTELEWVHSDRKFVGAQIFSLRKQLNSRSTVTPRLGILVESQPTWRTSSAFADLTWRYRLHSDWVYGELIPALNFPRDKNFTEQASVVFRIELYFSGNIQRTD